MKKKIYVAGAYTHGDVAINVKKAIELGDALADLGYAPYIPHLSHFWHMLHPREVEFWYEHDLEWLAVCDAIVVLEPEVESRGVKREIEFAEGMGIPLMIIPWWRWKRDDLHHFLDRDGMKEYIERFVEGKGQTVEDASSHK